MTATRTGSPRPPVASATDVATFQAAYLRGQLDMLDEVAELTPQMGALSSGRLREWVRLRRASLGANDATTEQLLRAAGVIQPDEGVPPR